MIEEKLEEFSIDWILRNKIGLGKSPSNKLHFEQIKKKGIKSILNLCTEEESPTLDEFINDFEYSRYPLPDHKVQRKLKEFEIIEVIDLICDLLESGPIFIHCFASVERSPFICIAWLVLKEKIKFFNALDHVKQVHRESNPMGEHLSLLRNLIEKKIY